jgi:hypothetical protein
MHLYMSQMDEPLHIVRGGIFGGTLPYVSALLSVRVICLDFVSWLLLQIECILKAYTIAMHQTLTDGYLGTQSLTSLTGL